MTRFDRESKGRRRHVARRQIARRILILCGGKKTEPAYFEALKSRERNPAVSIRVRSEIVSPLELVRSAVKVRNRDADAFDEIWTVFDVDQFRIEEAVRLGVGEGIKTVLSNPCFELWLLLHFQDQTAHLADYDATLRLLRRHVPRYDKADLSFSDYEKGVEDACARAHGLLRQDSRNPVTEVVHICEAIIRKPN